MGEKNKIRALYNVPGESIKRQLEVLDEFRRAVEAGNVKGFFIFADVTGGKLFEVLYSGTEDVPGTIGKLAMAQHALMNQLDDEFCG